MNDRELLSAYLDGELTPDLARRVEERLAADPRLRAEHERLLLVSAALRVPCDADPGFLVRLRLRREELSPIPRWTWPQLGRRLAAAAAVLLVAAGVSEWRAALPPESPSAAPDSAEAADEEPDLLTAEGRIFAAPDPAGGESAELDAPELEILGAADAGEEPVLLIALGDALAPPGER